MCLLCAYETTLVRPPRSVLVQVEDAASTRALTQRETAEVQLLQKLEAKLSEVLARFLEDGVVGGSQALGFRPPKSRRST